MGEWMSRQKIGSFAFRLEKQEQAQRHYCHSANYTDNGRMSRVKLLGRRQKLIKGDIDHYARDRREKYANCYFRLIVYLFTIW